MNHEYMITLRLQNPEKNVCRTLEEFDNLILYLVRLQKNRIFITLPFIELSEKIIEEMRRSFINDSDTVYWHSITVISKYIRKIASNEGENTEPVANILQSQPEVRFGITDGI